MTYQDVVNANQTLQINSPTWWRSYAFHFTDVQNAVSILDSGYLYSRFDAKKMRLMKTENASTQVIKMTNPEVYSFVRFYFRPKTPTQYHNEGYKHIKLRYDGDPNANVPVPIFFLFDLVKLLDMPKTKFSGTALSGKTITSYKGSPEEFSQLPFERIYSNGPMNMLRPESRTEGVKNKEYLLSLERRGRHGEKPEDVSGVIQEAGGDRGAGKQEDSSGNRF